MKRWSILSLLVFCAFSTSCSLIKVDFEPCEEVSDCTAAFGPGFVCVDRMFCEQLEPDSRCTTLFPTDLLSNPENHRGRVLFGAIFDTTDTTQSTRMDAVKLAITEADIAGGLDGRPVGLIGCSNNGPGDGAQTDLRSAELARLLERELDVAALIGPSSSGSVELTFNQTDDILIISPSATSPRLVGLEPEPSDELAGRLWRTTAADSQQGLLIVDDIVDRRQREGVLVPEEVAIVHQEGAYGDGIASVVRAEFQRRFEDAPAVVTFAFQAREQIDSIVVSLGRTPQVQELIFASSDIDDTRRFMELIALNDEFDERSIFFTDSAANGGLLEAAEMLGIRDSFFDNVRGTRPSSGGTPLYESVITALGEESRNALFATHSYDAAWLAMYATAYRLIHEDDDTGEEACGAGCGMRRFRTLGVRETCIDASSAIQEALMDPNATIDIQGASGSLSYRTGAGGVEEEELDADFELWQVNDDRTGFVAIEPSAAPSACTGTVDSR